MSSNPSYQQHLGLEATNTCFFSSSSMMGSEAPFFHPNMAHDAASGFGDPSGNEAEFFMGNNNAMMVTSPANQLVWAAPSQNHASMSADEMDAVVAYSVASESCSTVHSMLPAVELFQYGGPSDVVTIAQPSKMTGDAHCSWTYHDAPPIAAASSIHEPYYHLTAFSGAASKLSPSVGAAKSSSDVTMAAHQSSEVTCSGLTHVNSGEGFGYAGTGLFQPLYAGDEELQQQVYARRPLHFSRFAHVAEELLSGFVGCLLKDVVGETTTDSVSGVDLLSSSCTERTPSSTVSSNQLWIEHRRDGAGGERWMEAQNLRDDLLKLLQLMDQRCNRCHDEIQTTASKFSSIAVPPFAHRSVSVMYGRTRKRITRLIMAVAQPSSLAEKERSWESLFIQKHWALQQLRRSDQQSWRPQRGLPEKSVAVLKSWMFENFLRPYPKDNEKEMLAARSGLSRSQVSNWFINARVRLWKPMIEEMYEELRRTSGGGSSNDVVVS